MAKTKSKTPTKVSELIPDPTNYNQHSEFGMALLEKSIRKFGFVEAGLISEDGVICSGNARQETSVNIGMEDLQIIDIDGTKPVYLRKKGLKSGSKEFKELGLALNAVPKANIVFDAELIEAELGEAIMVEWGVQYNLNEESVDLIKQHTDSGDKYMNNMVRQILLVYDVDTHKVIVEKLKAIGEKHGIGEDNSAVVLKLIEHYEGN